MHINFVIQLPTDAQIQGQSLLVWSYEQNNDPRLEIGQHFCLNSLLQFMDFSIGFSSKKNPKMTSVKKTTLSIWTNHFVHV
jgi:hypothetical protein